jgi:DNA invertase Pin-like site-specific DNA recombinase
MTRAAIYLRVSITGDSPENEEAQLRAVAERAGWVIAAVYCDQGINGSNGRGRRPALDALRKDAGSGKFDVVMAWSVDRLGHSLKELTSLLAELQALDIDLFLKAQDIDTTTPAGKAMLRMLGVVADFERTMVRERVLAGLARARAAGARLGRPRIPRETEDAIRAALAQPGRPGVRKIAAQFGVDPSTVVIAAGDGDRKASCFTPSVLAVSHAHPARFAQPVSAAGEAAARRSRLGVRYGPGSAAHRFASASCRAAPGIRR